MAATSGRRPEEKIRLARCPVCQEQIEATVTFAIETGKATRPEAAGQGADRVVLEVSAKPIRLKASHSCDVSGDPQEGTPNL